MQLKFWNKKNVKKSVHLPFNSPFLLMPSICHWRPFSPIVFILNIRTSLIHMFPNEVVYILLPLILRLLLNIKPILLRRSIFLRSIFVEQSYHDPSVSLLTQIKKMSNLFILLSWSKRRLLMFNTVLIWFI